MRMRFTILVTLFAASLVVAPRATAAVPNLLAWQGVALDSTNTPLADGSYMFSFSIWSAGDGGDSLWGETQVIDVQNGVLNVLLGELVFLPDFVFNLPDRWLQVQFESEAPYYPRTRIVSVAYAFRVGSLNGASGGAVSSNIDLKNAFASPGLRLFREGTSTVIGEMAGGGAGGKMTLYDESGVPTATLQPSLSDGGQFVLWTHPAQSTGIAMDNTGNDNPYLLMQGQSTAAYLSMDSVGDPSVELPPSAISKTEILDEPGLAASPSPASSIAIGTSYTTIASATASFPNSGYALLFGEASIAGATASSWMSCRILEDAVAKSYCFWDAGDTDPWYDQRQSMIATMPVTKGTHTYTMELYQNSGSASVAYPKLTVLYVPTAYGVVSSPAPPLGNFGEAEVATGQQLIGPPGIVDVAAERSLAIEANDARIATEMEEMKARVARLEKLLQERAGDSNREDR
jgi:hypothetical protein